LVVLTREELELLAKRLRSGAYLVAYSGGT